MRTPPPPRAPHFYDFKLAPELARAVEALGYETPTEIQQKAIPLGLEGRDVLGCAQTGTGKTAAFALPILERMNGKVPGVLRCLVLTPTRELAVQVADSFRDYARFLPYQCGTVFGGVDMWHQVAMLKRGVDVLVATPGRLLDHMHRGNLDFGGIEVAVLDEADRMLDMGFIDDVRQIMSCLPRQRQTMLFSATLDPEIRRLAADLLNDPISVQVSRDAGTTAEGVRQVLHYVSANAKRDLLRHLIDRHRMHSAIVFVRTKDGADKIARFLENTGVSVGALHSNKTQAARLSILEGFKYGRIRILVATDIAARGLDIPAVSHVINFDVPNSPEDYVHRIGRTARAGEKGDAITLATTQERHQLAGIERLIKKEIPAEDVAGYTIPGWGAPAAPARREERGGRAESGARGRGGRDAQREAPARPARGEERGRDDGGRDGRDELHARDRGEHRGGRGRGERGGRGRSRGGREARDEDRGGRAAHGEERSRDDGGRDGRDEQQARDREERGGRDRGGRDRGAERERGPREERGRDAGREAPPRDEDRGRHGRHAPRREPAPREAAENAEHHFAGHERPAPGPRDTGRKGAPPPPRSEHRAGGAAPEPGRGRTRRRFW